LALVLLLIGAFLVDRPQPRADLVFVNRGELHTLDPQRMSWLQDFRIAYNLYEGLVRWDNDNFLIEPALAHTWEISEDQTVYTFHFRPDAYWSNGDLDDPDNQPDPVTAYDFVYSWKRALLPDTAADYSDLFYRIKNGEQFFNYRSTQLAAFAERDSKDRTLEAAQLLRDEADRVFAETVGIRAIDDHTLVVTLERPTPYILDLFAFPVFYPVHPETVESYVSLDAATGYIRQAHGWTKPDTHVGNGPYVLNVWRYNRDLRLERNPCYWNRSQIASGSVASIAVADPNTSILAFETGAIDWLSDVSGVNYRADMLQEALRYRKRTANAFAELRTQFVQELHNTYGEEFDTQVGDRINDPNLGYDWIMSRLADSMPPIEGERNNIHAFPAYGTYFYNFNCQEKFKNGRPNPFYHAAVRRAFTMAVNKRAIVERVTRMNQPVATTFIPPGSIPGCASPAGLSYDTDKARQELESAGWIDRDGDGVVENSNNEPFPTVEILYETGGGHEAVAQAIAAMWERELRVRCSTVGQESKTAGERKKTHDFIISRANWFGDYGDPTTFLDLFRSTNNNNDRGYSNPVFDALMNRTDREPDSAKRMRLLEQAEAMIVNEEVPLLPIYHRITVYMYEPGRVRNISTHPRLVQYLWELEAVTP